MRGERVAPQGAPPIFRPLASRWGSLPFRGSLHPFLVLWLATHKECALHVPFPYPLSLQSVPPAPVVSLVMSLIPWGPMATGSPAGYFGASETYLRRTNASCSGLALLTPSGCLCVLTYPLSPSAVPHCVLDCATGSWLLSNSYLWVVLLIPLVPQVAG